ELGKMGVDTGSFANQAGYQTYKAQRRRNSASPPLRRTGEPRNSDETASSFIGVCVGIFLFFYTLNGLSFAWYVSLPLAIIGATTTSRLLTGPLRFVLTLLRWLCVFGLIAFVLWVFSTLSLQ